MAKRATLATVAHEAQVSRQTVSNVLNNPEVVKPDTLHRVQEVIARLGYRPSPVARQLRTQESRVIGLRIPPAADGINGSILDGFLHALTTALQEQKYRVMLFAGQDSHDEVAQYSALLDLLNVDGFVLTSTHSQDPRPQWLAERNVPFVSFGRPWGELESNNSWVDVDSNQGTYQATKDLLALGHTKIAFVGWPHDSETGNERRAGWAQAMKEANEGFEAEDWTTFSQDSQTEGANAWTDLEARVKPTAYVCASDSLAVGIYTQALKTGHNPAIIGFDNTPVAQALGISSVEQDVTRAAQEITELLLQQLNSHTVSDPVLITPHVEHRATSHHVQG